MKDVIKKLWKCILLNKMSLPLEVNDIWVKLLCYFRKLFLRDKRIVVTVYQRYVLLVLLYLFPLPRRVEVATLLFKFYAKVTRTRRH